MDRTEPELEQTLGAFDVAALTVGTVIGSGVFVVPGVVLRATGGSVTLALTLWVVGGVLAGAGALTLAELGSARPQAGGIYVFIRDAFGRGPAFLFGWSMLLAGVSGTLATLVVAFAETLPGSTAAALGGKGVTAVLALIGITMLNLGTARANSLIQGVSSLLKVGALVGAALLVSSTFGLHPREPLVGAGTAPMTGASIGSIVGALVAVLWAYDGWQTVSFATGEIRDARRNYPRGLLLGTLTLVALYLTVNAVCAIALGPTRLVGSGQPLVESVALAGYPAVSDGLRIFVGFSILAAAHATLFTGARVIYAMARDGLFFRAFAKLSPRSHVPVRAAVACSVIATFLALFNAFDALLSLTVVTNWIFIGLAAASLFVFRRREAPAPFRVPLYPVMPALFILASATIVTVSWISGPPLARYGLVVLVAGLIVFQAWSWRADRTIPQN